MPDEFHLINSIPQRYYSKFLAIDEIDNFVRAKLRSGKFMRFSFVRLNEIDNAFIYAQLPVYQKKTDWWLRIISHPQKFWKLFDMKIFWYSFCHTEFINNFRTGNTNPTKKSFDNTKWVGTYIHTNIKLARIVWTHSNRHPVYSYKMWRS